MEDSDSLSSLFSDPGDSVADTNWPTTTESSKPAVKYSSDGEFWRILCFSLKPKRDLI